MWIGLSDTRDVLCEKGHHPTKRLDRRVLDMRVGGCVDIDKNTAENSRRCLLVSIKWIGYLKNQLSSSSKYIHCFKHSPQFVQLSSTIGEGNPCLFFSNVICSQLQARQPVHMPNLTTFIMLFIIKPQSLLNCFHLIIALETCFIIPPLVTYQSLASISILFILFSSPI